MAKLSKSKHLSNLIDNIEKDRKATILLLDDITTTILSGSQSKKEDYYRNMGPVAGKYLEVLQKINEQYIKALTTIDGQIKETEEIDVDELDKAGSPIISKKELEELYGSIEKK